jgi:hypothetical protein
MNYQVKVNGFTFISDSKDSETVTVIGNGQNRTMRRADAVALYKEHAALDKQNVIVPPQGRRVPTGQTNILRHK